MIICSFVISNIHLTAQSKTILLNASINSYSLNRFNIKSSDSSYISGLGFNIGFAYEKPIFKGTALMLGLEFSQRKYDFKDFKLPNAFWDNYASFPLNINFYLLKNFIIQAGCQYDHLIFKQKIVYYQDSAEQKSGYTKYDFGLNLGIRIQCYNFELNGSYNYGLKKIFNGYFYDLSNNKYT
ncbi:MAG: outer membrane beta-barrel protein, partial [Saprospiraceae bacterium]